MTEKENLTIKLSNNEVVKFDSLATFDGVAIAREVKEEILVILRSRPDDLAFREKVQRVYQEARQLLVGLERGQEIIDALGDPLQEGR